MGHILVFFNLGKKIFDKIKGFCDLYKILVAYRHKFCYLKEKTVDEVYVRVAVQWGQPVRPRSSER